MQWEFDGGVAFKVGDTTKSLPAGYYETKASPRGFFLQKREVVGDSLIDIPGSVSHTILTEITRFWNRRALFARHGFLHKRGVLMHGLPGSGKTCTVRKIIEGLITEHDGIGVLVHNPRVASECLTMIRQIEPDRPIVAVYEDIDGIIEEYGDGLLLSLLDGEVQIGGIVHMATTNNIDKLDKRFRDRPSRFDMVVEVGMPSAAMREAFIKSKFPEIDNLTLRRWIDRSEGYAIAHLRELIVASQCIGVPEADIFARLDEMKKRALEAPSENSDYDDDDDDDDEMDVIAPSPHRLIGG